LAALLPSVGDLERAPREARREVGWEPDIALPAERIALDVDGRFWHGDGHHKTRDSRGRDLRKVQAFAPLAGASSVSGKHHSNGSVRVTWWSLIFGTRRRSRSPSPST